MSQKMEEYEFKLSDEYREIALRDLREDDLIRKQSLEQMIEWIQKHPYIKSCRTDPKFLLAFLRKKKFNTMEVRTLLEDFLRFRESNYQWFRMLTIKDKAIEDMIDTGYNIYFPKKDKNGRRYVWHRTASVNPDTYNVDVSMRAMSLMFQTILHDEESQVGGITAIIDHAGLTWNHAKLLTIFELREILGSYKVMPLRVKDVLIVNMPPFLHKVAEILDPFICNMFNMEKRKIYRDWEELRKVIDVDVLPEDLGGNERPTAEILKDFKEKIVAYENETKDYPQLIYDSPNETKNWDMQKTENGSGGLAGSFRKLEID